MVPTCGNVAAIWFGAKLINVLIETARFHISRK